MTCTGEPRCTCFKQFRIVVRYLLPGFANVGTTTSSSLCSVWHGVVFASWPAGLRTVNQGSEYRPCAPLNLATGVLSDAFCGMLASRCSPCARC